MAKFKPGNLVRNLEATRYVPKYATGVVIEDNSQCPYVIWNEVTQDALKTNALNPRRWAREEGYLELVNPDDPTNKAIELLKQAIFQMKILLNY